MKFCRAFGDRVCLDGTVRDAEELFTQVNGWPNTDPQAPVADICSGRSHAKAFDKHEPDGDEMRICGTCKLTTRSPLNHRPDILSLIESPSQDAIRWCGEYLVSLNAEANLKQSPFQQHREEILRNWKDSSVSLAHSVCLLTVLISFSLVSLVGMTHWYFVPESEEYRTFIL